MKGIKGISIFSNNTKTTFNSPLRAFVVFSLIVLFTQTSFADNSEQIRTEIYLLAENWIENQGRMVHLLNNPDPLVRKHAVEAIPLSVTPEIPIKVVPLINDPDPDVRYQAINRFVDWKLPEAVQPLTESLYSKNNEIKKITIMALAGQSCSLALSAIEKFADQTEERKWLDLILDTLESINYGDPELNVQKKEILIEIKAMNR